MTAWARNSWRYTIPHYLLPGVLFGGGLLRFQTISMPWRLRLLSSLYVAYTESTNQHRRKLLSPTEAQVRDLMKLTMVIQYSMYGHIQKLADAEKAGIEQAGGKADLYQIQETLPDEVLGSMRASPKSNDIPVLDNPQTLAAYDGFLVGIPTRYGNLPTQWKVTKQDSEVAQMLEATN